jgi:hypothetical protein
MYNIKIKILYMKPHEAENWTYLYSKMKNEGFHYCFKHYSSFEEIEDEQFHKLRKQYLEIALELEHYVKNKYNEANWEVEYIDEEDEDDR